MVDLELGGSIARWRRMGEVAEAFGGAWRSMQALMLIGKHGLPILKFGIDLCDKFSEKSRFGM